MPSRCAQGTLASLYRATNAIILGDRLAEKIGARLGANLSVQATEGVRINAQVVGLFRSGIRAVDEGTAYVLVKTGQILANQTGLVNELRVRVTDPMAAAAVAQRIEREIGYKSVAWQEANEDLLSAFIIRNVIMYTVVGAILLVASFGTYNIISTITHEKTRDIAIMKSLGIREATVRRIFVLEALVIGLIGALAGWVFGYAPHERPRCGRDQESDDRYDAPAGRLLLPALRRRRGRGAGLLLGRRLLPGAQGLARSIPSTSSGARRERAETGCRGRRPALIVATSVTRILPGVVPTTLVHGIDLAISDNEFVAITGPSGSGKSSLLYLLGLLDLPTTGEVRIRGRATAHMDEPERALTRLSTLGFVFQFHFLLPEFSALENVMLPMRAMGALSDDAMRARARTLLGSLGLADHALKRPDQLSGGQRQRVAVARALANDPPLILADEPTGSLDSASSEQVFQILRDLVDKDGKTVVAVTHDLGLAARMDRQIRLADGAIASDEQVRG